MIAKFYKSYRCDKCNREFVLLTADADNHIKSGKYIACPYCNSRRVRKEKVGDTLKECMKERSYARVKGAIREKI